MNQNQTTVDTNPARQIADDIARDLFALGMNNAIGPDLASAPLIIGNLADALDEARRERDEAVLARDSIKAHCYGGQEMPDAYSRAERAEAEAAALRAAMPDPDTLSEIANSLHSLSANPYHCELRNAVYGWEEDIREALATTTQEVDNAD